MYNTWYHSKMLNYNPQKLPTMVSPIIDGREIKFVQLLVPSSNTLPHTFPQTYEAQNIIQFFSVQQYEN